MSEARTEALRTLCLLLIFLSPAATRGEDPAYRKVVEERAAKIVEKVATADGPQRERVVGLVADQYVALSEVHAASAGDPVKLFELHRSFVAALEAELDPAGVEAVKDGMTYGVVPITYEGYLRLVPELSEDQKRMIRACLLEAREYAMDAGSSEEKHRWFGKYKGRINNRLSQAGIDLKRAERELAERQRPVADQP